MVLFALDIAPAQANAYPFQNQNLPVEERFSNAVALMTLTKRSTLKTGSPSMDRNGLFTIMFTISVDFKNIGHCVGDEVVPCM
jgi:hypothetical protein